MTPRFRASWMFSFAVVAFCGLLIGCGTGPAFTSQNGNTNQAVGDANISPSPNSPSAASSHSVTLSWQPSSSSDVVGYNVYRGVQPGNFALLRSMQSGTRYVDTAIQDGNTYYYIVTAVSSTGDESLSSNVAEAIVAPASSPATGQPSANIQSTDQPNSASPSRPTIGRLASKIG